MTLELLIHNHTPIITSEDEEALALAIRSYLLAECEKLKKEIPRVDVVSGCPFCQGRENNIYYNQALTNLMKALEEVNNDPTGT